MKKTIKCRFSFRTIGNWKGCALTTDGFQRAVIACNGTDKQKKGCPIWNRLKMTTNLEAKK